MDKFDVIKLVCIGLTIIISIVVVIILAIIIIKNQIKHYQKQDTYIDKLDSHISAIEKEVTNQETTNLEEETPDILPRYGFTEPEIRILAQVLCGDGSVDGDGEYDIDFQDPVNEFEVGKVLCVIMNRQRHDLFPSTIHDILLAEGQFSMIHERIMAEPSEKALEIVKKWCEAYDKYDLETQVVPENHLYFRGNGVTNTTHTNWR